ncbi:MAG: hypothetical protein JSV62_03740 [Promethearchaeota archaeon]|nr:MAG: hypothetical protein JSV62_03740 [Candidatus Lokiarchaeota archaeon]
MTNYKNHLPKNRDFEIAKYRNLREKLNSLTQIESLLPSHRYSFENLYHFVNKLPDLDKILFIIAKESLNNTTVYSKIIEQQLLLFKPNNHGRENNSKNNYVDQKIKQLKKKDLIEIHRKCPYCNYDYGTRRQRLQKLCFQCKRPIFSQPVNFEKKTNGPFYTIELTEKGWEHLCSVIDSIFKACYFCIEWLKFFNSKAKK